MLLKSDCRNPTFNQVRRQNIFILTDVQSGLLGIQELSNFIPENYLTVIDSWRLINLFFFLSLDSKLT